MRFLRIVLVTLLVVVPALSTPRSDPERPSIAAGPPAGWGGETVQDRSGAPMQAPTGRRAPSPVAEVASPRVGAPLTIGPRNVHEPSSIHPVPERQNASAPPEMTAPPAIASGLASWYFAGDGLYAAMPGYVDGTRVSVRVCRGSLCLVLQVVTQCRCDVGRPRPIVDLSRDAFARFAPLSLGLIVVTVERLP